MSAIIKSATILFTTLLFFKTVTKLMLKPVLHYSILPKLTVETLYALVGWLNSIVGWLAGDIWPKLAGWITTICL